MTKTKNVQMHSFFVVLKLFNKFYWKSIYGPFWAFGLSFILYSILGSIMDYKVIFPGILASSALAQGIIGMPCTILELKSSILLKRIGASPIKSWIFIFVIVFYYFVIIVLTIFYLMMWAIIFTQKYDMFNGLFTSIKAFATFFYGMFLNTLASIAIGFFIVSFAKSSSQAQAIGMICFSPLAFLSGQFILPEFIARNETMLWVSRCVPFRYATMFMSETWQGWVEQNPFNFNDGFDKQIFYNDGFYKYFNDSSILKDEWFTIDNILKKSIPNNNDIETITQFLKAKESRSELIEIFDKWDHIFGQFVPQIITITTLSFAFKNFEWSSKN